MSKTSLHHIPARCQDALSKTSRTVSLFLIERQTIDTDCVYWKNDRKTHRITWIMSKTGLHYEQNIIASHSCSTSKWSVKNVKNGQSILDRTLENRYWFCLLKEWSKNSQDYLHYEQNIIASHTCSMSKWAVENVKNGQLILDRTLDNRYWLCFLKEWSKNSQDYLNYEQNMTALWAKYHCITQLLDVKMICQKRQEGSVDSW